jgi:hypothetical protein
VGVALRRFGNELFGKMKDKLKKILSYFKKGNVAQTGSRGPNPHRDWHIIIGVFFILTICTAFANYVYYTSHSDNLTGIDTPSGPKLKVGQIEEVANYIKAKQSRYDAIISGPIPNIDPN